MFFKLSKAVRGISFIFVTLLISTDCAQAKPTIEWDPEKLEIRQSQGTTQTYTLNVSFSKNATDVIARVVPSLEQWVSVSPVSFGDISAGEDIELEIIVSIPSGENPVNRGGVVQLRGGKKQKNLAKPLPIDLTIIPETSDGLPPDPGEAGKETLLGIDSDLDGVRDDIQRYIVLTYPDQHNLQNALFQVSRTYQRMLDPDLISGTEQDVANQVSKDIECLYYVNEDNAHKVLLSLRAETLNTYERSKKYLAYDKNLSGKTFSLSRLPLSEHFKLCDFEIQ